MDDVIVHMHNDVPVPHRLKGFMEKAKALWWAWIITLSVGRGLSELPWEEGHGNTGEPLVDEKFLQKPEEARQIMKKAIDSSEELLSSAESVLQKMDDLHSKLHRAPQVCWPSCLVHMT